MSSFAEAEAQIRQLHARYTDAVWRKDRVTFGRCFASDAEWRIAGMVLSGRDAIAEAFGRMTQDAKRVLMSVETPLLALTGQDTANGRVYVVEQCTWRSKAANTNLGRYHDRYRRIDGQWCFAWRLFQLLYQGPGDFSGALFAHDDFGPFPAMPPLDAVPPAQPALECQTPRPAPN